jgi:hypothetical protein
VVLVVSITGIGAMSHVDRWDIELILEYWLFRALFSTKTAFGLQINLNQARLQ